MFQKQVGNCKSLRFTKNKAASKEYDVISTSIHTTKNQTYFCPWTLKKELKTSYKKLYS